MPIHTHIVLAGTFLAIPLSPFVQCGDVDTGGDGKQTALGGDEELTVLGEGEEPTVLGEDEEPRFFPGLILTANLENLGKRVFFDEISRPKNRMGCATCHDPTTGWTFPDEETNLGQVAATGADPTTVGTIKAPSSAYASFVPKFQECPAGLSLLCGGLFWDGRAEGNENSLFPDGATDHVGLEVFEFKNGNFKGPLLKFLYQDFLGPLADQALNPFSNPVEQNISIRDVCKHVAKSEYAHVYKSAWLEAIDCSDKPYGASKEFKAYEVSFRRIATALAAYQASDEVNSFSSKRDKALWKELWGKDKDSSPGKFPLKGLTAQENLGHDLFYNTRPNPFAPADELNAPPKPDLPVTNCSFCHRSSQELIDGTDPQERYTDDAYHNIGVPKNDEIPANSLSPVNGLLAAHTGRELDTGLARTPTLRNVDKRPKKSFAKAYMHNGWFKSLESVVHFYNTARVAEIVDENGNNDLDLGGATASLYGVTRCPSDTTVEEALANNCWPKPEFPNSAIETPLVGDLGLTLEQEAAIVAYLKTFTDTKTVKPPKQHKWGHDHH